MMPRSFKTLESVRDFFRGGRSGTSKQITAWVNDTTHRGLDKNSIDQRLLDLRKSGEIRFDVLPVQGAKSEHFYHATDALLTAEQARAWIELPSPVINVPLHRRAIANQPPLQTLWRAEVRA